MILDWCVVHLEKVWLAFVGLLALCRPEEGVAVVLMVVLLNRAAGMLPWSDTSAGSVASVALAASVVFAASVVLVGPFGIRSSVS